MSLQEYSRIKAIPLAYIPTKDYVDIFKLMQATYYLATVSGL